MDSDSSVGGATHTTEFPAWDAVPREWVEGDYEELRVVDAKVTGECGDERVSVELELVR